MPLTPFQREVLRVIGRNRSPESHIAGGIALNSGLKSARFSEDIDIFHEADEQLDKAFRSDVLALRDAGMDLSVLLDSRSYRRAEVRHANASVVLDWAIDSCFRFFPIIEDEILIWKLHPFDAITNKALTLASRSETRDLVDIVQARETYPLFVIAWAACAKDPGFTPSSLLEMMKRFARIDVNALNEMNSNIPAQDLKSSWQGMAIEAEQKIAEAANRSIEPGVLFLSNDGKPVWWDGNGAAAHRASVGGVWPEFLNRRHDRI